ncbi:MAG: hypothetical protein ACK5RF_19820 [Pirellula sp.]|jgi:hypothetical protein
MLILCAIVGVLLCLTCIFFLLAHPMICVVQCAFSKELSGGQKALWIFLSLLFGIVGSLPYALIGSGSARMRSLTWNGIKLGALNLLLAVGVFAATPEIRNGLGVSLGDESMSPVVFDSAEMSASLGEISAILEEHSNALLQPEEPRFVSVVNPEPATENTPNSGVTVEIDPTVQNNAANTTFLDDLVGAAVEVGDEPKDKWLPEENADAFTTQENTDRKEIAGSPDNAARIENTESLDNTDRKESTENQDSVVNMPLETITTMESTTSLEPSIAAKLQDDLLPGRDSSETQTTDLVTPSKTEPRDPPLSTMPKCETPSKNKPINRYRPEGYDVVEATLPNRTTPQSLKVRNRYTNP